MKERRLKVWLIQLLFLVVLLGAAAQSALAQKAYPTKPIEMVNAWSPGGAMDVNIRALQTAAKRILGQPFVQVFKPGGGGIAGATDVAHAKPDGYRIMGVSSGEMTAGPNLTKTAYSLDSFAYVGRITVKPYAFIVKAGARWKDFGEFRQEALKNPGNLSVGSTSRGGVFLTMRYTIHQAGISLNFVPYGGAGPFIVAVLGGHVDSALAPAAAADSHLQAKTLKMLAVTGPKRMEDYPNVPTLMELGVDVPIVQWIGVVTPRRIPPERLAFLRKAFKRIVKDPQYIKTARKMGLVPAWQSAKEFEKAVREEDKQFKSLVKKLGLAPK